MRRQQLSATKQSQDAGLEPLHPQSAMAQLRCRSEITATFTFVSGIIHQEVWCTNGNKNWGSLIWRSEGLPTVGEWLDGGRVLPIEFSRIEAVGRMTLVKILVSADKFGSRQ
jgi:hypothetical protein